MRWEGDRESDNVEDRRGLPIGGRGLVTGGIGTIIVALIAMYFGVDPSVILNQVATSPPSAQQQADQTRRSPEENRLARFFSVVLPDTEDVWRREFREHGQAYTDPKMVLYSGGRVGLWLCPGRHGAFLLPE
jgi:predicted metalloprotease